jgi:hypothetical protein
MMSKKTRGVSPQANYTDRETAACRRSLCQLTRIEGATWSECLENVGAYTSKNSTSLHGLLQGLLYL